MWVSRRKRWLSFLFGGAPMKGSRVCREGNRSLLTLPYLSWYDPSRFIDRHHACRVNRTRGEGFRVGVPRPLPPPAPDILARSEYFAAPESCMYYSTYVR